MAPFEVNLDCSVLPIYLIFRFAVQAVMAQASVNPCFLQRHRRGSGPEFPADRKEQRKSRKDEQKSEVKRAEIGACG